MKLSVLFPMHTESLNAMLGANSRFVAQSRAKRERHTTGLALSQLPKVDHAVVARGVTVTLCRVSPGVLDRANLHGALKHVEDAVATWLGRDDRDPTITWNEPEQQKCERGYHGVRVTYEDDREGKDFDVVLGTGPKRLAEASPRGGGELPPKDRRRVVRDLKPDNVQLTLPGPRAWLLLPWDQDGSGVPVLEELEGDPTGRRSRVVELPALVPGAFTPSQRAEVLRLRARAIVGNGRPRIRLEAFPFTHPELGGAAVVYALSGAPELAWFSPIPHCDVFDPTTPDQETAAT